MGKILEAVPYVSLSSETVKREICIALVLSRIAALRQQILRISDRFGVL